MTSSPSATEIINKPRKVVRNAFVITALMIGGAVITGYSSLDGMEGGYALIVAFGFLALIAFITAIVYIPRAREFDKLTKDLNPLAHWAYSQQEWDEFIKEDLKETLTVNKATLRLVIIISIIVCAILLLMYKDNLFILIIGGLILLLSIVAFTAPLIRKRILSKGIHEAFIGKDSAFVGGTFQTWKHLNARLINVEIDATVSIPILHIEFEFPTLQGMQQSIVRIPVPEGKMDEANRIVIELQKQI